MNGALIAGTIGLVIAVLVALRFFYRRFIYSMQRKNIIKISAAQRKSILKKSAVNFPEEDTTFEYQGGYYDKKIYYKLIKIFYSNVQLDYLKSQINETEKLLENPELREISLIQMCAIKKSIDERTTDKSSVIVDDDKHLNSQNGSERSLESAEEAMRMLQDNISKRAKRNKSKLKSFTKK
jgi:hypothetical protein